MNNTAALCELWSPGSGPGGDGAYRCGQCNGTWIEHARYAKTETRGGVSTSRFTTMPRAQTRLSDHVEGHECRHWRPVRKYPEQSASKEQVCAGCGGAWDSHATIHRASGLGSAKAPLVPVKAPEIGPASMAPAPSAPSACRAFSIALGGRAKHISDDECGNCHFPRRDHTEPLYLGDKQPNVLYYDVLVRNVVEADGRSITVGIGRHNDRDVAFVATTKSLARVVELLKGDWGNHGVLVWVPEQDIQVRADGQGDVVSPAVYVGQDVGVEGAKPTLVEGQGVFVIRQTVSANLATAVAHGGTECAVVYDMTDGKYYGCQWPVGTVITDVPGSDLVINGNWRRHIPGNAYSSVSREPRVGAITQP